MADIEEATATTSLLPVAPSMPMVSAEGSTSAAWDMQNVFPGVLSSVLVALIACFAVFTKYGEIDTEEFYMYYIHVAIMIFVGFGFLMTFLRRYSLGAVSLNFLTSCMMMLFAILLHGAFDSKFESYQFITISVKCLIQGLFCAGAGMITFGALLGKASPTQLVLILLLEVPIYAFNAEYLVSGFWGKMGAQDFGGSIAIHVFGAYFGLAAAWVLYKKEKTVGGAHPKNGSEYINDVTAMIGTIFLWIYWPSFNAAVATVGLDAGEDMKATTAQLRMYAIINTSLSLCAATISTFAASAFFKGKLDMVLIQNATLAGGVAVGSATTMLVGTTVINITPGGAVAVGAIAGLLSSWGFVYLSDILEEKIGLRDTCGVHNLHGMPGLLGGLVPILALTSCCEHSAAHAQVLAVVCTLAIAIAGGAGSAFLVSFIPTETGEKIKELTFEDASAFEVEEDKED